MAVAQDGLVRKGDKHFDRLAFEEAIQYYERAAVKGADPSAIAAKLGDSYWNIRDLESAEKWYQKAVSMPDCAPQVLYRYASALRSNGKFEESDSWLNRYEARMENDARVDLQVGSTTYGPQLRSTSSEKVVITSMNLNSEAAELAPFIHAGKLYFASSRPVEINTKRRHSWDGLPFLDLYEGKIGPNGEVSEFSELDAINTSYHESNIAFSEDGKTIYFTRNNVFNGKKELTKDKVNNLQIFSRSLVNDEWMNEKRFPHSSNEYSTGHPTITADGLTMFFTSDMPGGQGGTDIWMTEFINGDWSTPTNLGPNVNTPGNEMFPFIHPSGLFFFASDGHKGLGGLDVLFTNLEKGNSTAIRNPGGPINSGADDFGLVMNDEMTRGYFVTNREGGKGNDDIMLFDLAAPFAGVLKIQGIAKDGTTGAPLPNVRVDILEKSNGNEVVGSVTTGTDGIYEFTVDADKLYQLDGTLDKFRSDTETVGTAGLNDMDSTMVSELVLFPENALTLVVNVKNSKTQDLLEDVDVQVSEMVSGDLVISGRTDGDGSIRTVLQGVAPGDELQYRVKLGKKGFAPEERMYRRKIESVGEVLVLEDLVPIEVGGDLAKLINLNPIYFDVSKHDIRPDAAAELDKIVKVMMEYPNMVIELGSHTDSRGSDAYNESLSDKRAKSSAAYIVSKGVDGDRITGKGYGEGRLVNECSNGVRCTKAQHQENRRTEFIVVKM